MKIRIAVVGILAASALAWVFMTAINTAVEVAPQEARDPRLQRVQTHYEAGEFFQAEQVAREVLRDEPDNVLAHRWLSAVYYDLGADSLARNHLRRVTESSPDDYRPWQLLGQIALDAEEFADAVSFFSRALDCKPTDEARSLMLQQYAKSLIRTRQFEKVISLGAGKVEDPTLLALIAEAHWATGDPDRADQVLGEAHAIDSNDRTVRILQAKRLMEAGEHRAAVEPLLALLSEERFDFEQRYRLATCYRRIGDLDKADKQTQLMKEAKKLREKLSELTELAMANPLDAAVRDQIADVFLQLDQPELEKVYRKAAEACRRRTSNRGMPDAGSP